MRSTARSIARPLDAARAAGRGRRSRSLILIAVVGVLAFLVQARTAALAVRHSGRGARLPARCSRSAACIGTSPTSPLALERTASPPAATRCRTSSAATPATLDEAGVARAAIESLAENFSDGVVAPVFWLAIGGLPGAALYKAINTADSMIGHRTPRHEAFGWAAARLDDLVNLPASRLSALLLVAAAALEQRCVRRRRRGAPCGATRRKHRSPNAG